MQRLIADQDFNHRILRALHPRLPDASATTALAIGFDREPDSALLRWVADNDAILLTQDDKTMHQAATARFDAGLPMARVIVVPQSMPLAQAIAELVLLLTCGEPDDWVNGLVRLPLL